MRDYIFHGKREDNGEWVEGYFVYNKVRNQYYIMDDVDSFPIPVYKESVGQHIGIDDIHGNKIFEHNIVRDMGVYCAHLQYVEAGIESSEEADKYRTYGKIGVVQFNSEDIASCGCCYPSFVGTGFKADEIDLTCCEVIGTVFENADLLEG